MSHLNHLNQPNLGLPTLSTRAMLVKLTQSKPRTRTRNTMGEAILRDELGDDANSVATKLFLDPANPCRILLNAHGEQYRDHIKLTREDEPRGPRLLVVALYDKYMENQRQHQANITTLTRKYLPDAATYDTWVQMDISRRVAARQALPLVKRDLLDAKNPITPAEYPTFDEFCSKLASTHKFSPLPDTRHPLFDHTDAELASVREAMTAEIAEREAAIVESVRAQNRQSVAAPLKKLLDKLRIPAGTPGSIFRDSAVENVIEAVGLARAMALGDEEVLAMCDEVAQAMSGYAANPQVLRDSPIVREQTAAKLAAVADRMGFMFANNGEN